MMMSNRFSPRDSYVGSGKTDPAIKLVQVRAGVTMTKRFVLFVVTKSYDIKCFTSTNCCTVTNVP